MTREKVLRVIQERFPEGVTFSTTDLAAVLAVPEYSVRGCIAWLVAGRLIAVTQECDRRHDRGGKPYCCARYRLLSDCATIRRVTQDRLHRGPAVAPDLSEAARFLSLPWR